MQSDWKEIYKLASQKFDKSEQVYKDVGNFVFAALYNHLRRPPSLITKLKGVGTWYLRRKRMNIALEKFPVDLDKPTPEGLSLFKHENKIEIHSLFVERLKDYDKYIELRNETRKLRHGNETLLEPPDRQD